MKKLLVLSLALLMIFQTLGGVAMAKDNNLILGKTAIIKTGEPVKYSYGLSGNDSEEPTLLTDGKYSPNTQFSNGSFHKFYRGATREIIFELDEMSAITGFSASFLVNNDAGIYLPRFCDLYVSENGEDYMLAYSLNDPTKISNVALRMDKYEMIDGARYKAKYVKFVFDVLVNVFCDELEVYGEEPNGTELPFSKDIEQSSKAEYDKGFEGLRDLVLIHCGYDYDKANNIKYESAYVNATEDMLLPYVAYLDKTQKITDTMFDSVLFISLQGLCPSGGKLYYQRGSYNTMEDWITFSESIFSETYNMGALDKVVAKVKKELDLPNYKFKVVVSLPYAYVNNTKAFGDINGDGVTEYIKNLDDKKAVYEWYTSYILETFNKKGYENLEFGGFYWLHESISYFENGGDVEIVKEVSKICKAKSTKLLWIPFYLAAGYEEWKELGFDTAYMQPNYITLDYAKEEMLGEFAETVRKHNLAVEMEIRWDAGNPSAPNFNRDVEKYRAYLKYGAMTGYMTESAHAYYQNAGPGTFYTASRSTNQTLRSLYDDTYKFIKGTYGIESPVIRSEDGSTEKGVRYYGDIKILDKGNANTNLKFVFDKEAENGVVKISSRSGSFSYTPNDDFVGVDSFTVRAFDGVKYSEPVTINITVTSKDERPQESDATSENDIIEKKPMDKLTLAISLGIAAAGAVATAILAVKKNRKKK